MIYLDSADLGEAAVAAEMGFVSGMTTNPSLMAKHNRPPLEQLRAVLDVFHNGPVFYQPGRVERAAAEGEAYRAYELDPTRVVLKLPATTEMCRLAFLLTEQGIACAMTAVYSPSQAIMAHQVGCQWVIPYVDRARRLLDGGEGLVSSLASVLEVLDSHTRVLAASLKTPEQVSRAVADGAHAVTLPMPVLMQLSEHLLTESAMAEFDQATK